MNKAFIEVGSPLARNIPTRSAFFLKITGVAGFRTKAVARSSPGGTCRRITVSNSSANHEGIGEIGKIVEIRRLFTPQEIKLHGPKQKNRPPAGGRFFQ